MGLLTSPKSARRQVSGYVTCGFAYTSPYTLTPGQPSPGRATLLRHPFGLPTTGLGRAIGQLAPKGSPTSCAQHRQPRHGRTLAGTGISTRCPSTTPVGLALGPDSPWADWPGPGTLGLSAGKVLTCLIATHACILTPTPSTAPSLGCFTGCRTLPYPINRC